MVKVFVQLSLGRYEVEAEPASTLHQLKAQCRSTIADLAPVNLKEYRFYLNGSYLTDDSKSLKDIGAADRDIFHLIKKTVCASAAVDTEPKKEEE